MLTLVLATKYAVLLDLMREVFAVETGVEALLADERNLYERADVDAIVVNHWVGFEIFGGSQNPLPPAHQSHPALQSGAVVLDTFPAAAERGLTCPPWVVVAPTFKIGPYHRLAPGEAMSLIMVDLFAAIDEFNALWGEEAIARLGYQLGSVQPEPLVTEAKGWEYERLWRENWLKAEREGPTPESVPGWRAEFEAIRRAYRAYRANHAPAELSEHE